MQRFQAYSVAAVVVTAMGWTNQCGGDDYNDAGVARWRNGPDSVNKDLATGRFRVGSDLETMCRAWPPQAIIQHGRYTTAVYGGIGPMGFSLDHTFVSASEGKLAHAFGRGCVWGCTFFTTLNEKERADWHNSYQPAQKAWQDVQFSNHRRQAAGFGLAGPPAAVHHPSTWLPSSR